MKKITLLFLLIVTIFLFCLPSLMASPPPSTVHNAPDKKNQDAFPLPDLGIEILTLAPIAIGHYLHFSFVVTDPLRALPLLNKKTSLYAVHDKSERKLVVPVTRIGAWRQTVREAEAGRHYFALLNTPSGVVNEGDMISIYLDEKRIAHLPSGFRKSRSLSHTIVPTQIAKVSQAKARQYKIHHTALVTRYQECVNGCEKEPPCVLRCKDNYATQSKALLSEMTDEKSDE